MSIGFAVATALMWREGLGLTLEFAVLTAFMASLAGYVGRDLGGKWGLRFVFGPQAVTADLPKGRSAIHRLPRQHLVIPYREIAVIETRLEAYRSFGMAMMQKPYVLRWRSGAMTFLFEERALGSGLESREFSNVVAELQARSEALIARSRHGRGARRRSRRLGRKRGRLVSAVAPRIAAGAAVEPRRPHRLVGRRPRRPRFTRQVTPRSRARALTAPPTKFKLSLQIAPIAAITQLRGRHIKSLFLLSANRGPRRTGRASVARTT